MRILLCGAHGFLGRHLSRTLLDSGHEVIRVCIDLATIPQHKVANY